RLGQYRIIGRIANGANARVKLGEHTLTGARVALKFIPRSRIQEMNIGPQVSREIHYMRLLSHPHIVKLYEVISTPTDIVLVMEYAPHELFKIIERGGRMSEAQARPWFQQLMYALAYSHSLKVVHRDLKPENILLTEDSTRRGTMLIKIADFGLSNQWSDGDWLKTGCGTPHYAAPEIIQGQLYGVEVDVWSSGAILYVMVCGRLPFDHDNMAALFEKITRADYQIPDDVYLSPELIDLLMNMMEPDPTKRLTVAEVLAHPWTRQETPRYLRQLYRRHMPLPPKPLIVPLSALVVEPTTPRATDDDNEHEDGTTTPTTPIGGIGEDDDDEWTPKWDEVIVADLAEWIGVEFATVMDALLSTEENAVKVAYALSADQRAEWMGLDSDSDDDELDGAADDSANALEWRLPSTFGVLSNRSYSPPPTSPQLASASSSTTPDPSHPIETSTSGSTLVDNMDAMNLSEHDRSREERRQRRKQRTEHKRLRNPKPFVWHFGIRSVSPPMEVMTELYYSLKALGIEWREKRGPWIADADCCSPEDAIYGGVPFVHDEALRGASKDDLDIFTLELRWRKRNIVALMKLRLYKTDPEAYMVDFVWVGHYKASTLPGAPRFEREDSSSRPPSDAVPRLPRRKSSMMNPLLFFECACELIAELTGVG
ncbi:Pkinase-domain-containing protein, partial [Clavulina sp. PMI_390]